MFVLAVCTNEELSSTNSFYFASNETNPELLKDKSIEKLFIYRISESNVSKKELLKYIRDALIKNKLRAKEGGDIYADIYRVETFGETPTRCGGITKIAHVHYLITNIFFGINAKYSIL